MSNNQFVKSGTWYFVDMIIMAIGGWAYWLVLSQIISSSEIGKATLIISLVLTVTVITQLGFEYPLLKKSQTDRKKIFGSIVSLELIITLGCIPFVIYFLNTTYSETPINLIMIVLIMVFFSQIGFVTRFSLLGTSKVKNILIADTIGVGIRFFSGLILVSIGFAELGIIISFMLQFLAIAIISLIFIKKVFLFKIGSLLYVKELLFSGLVNAPAKLARLLVPSLSVILLGFFGISDSEIGIFYIALMISILTGGFAASVAFTSIPASTSTKKDLSSVSLRIGLSLTIPFIILLISIPEYILSLIGPEYAEKHIVLTILSLSIFPYSIIMNAISKFNTTNESKKIFLIGIIQITVLLLCFTIFVDNYGTIGAALSILLAFIVSSIPAMFWLGRNNLLKIAVAGLAVFIGWSTAMITNSFNSLPIVLVVIVSQLATFLILLVLKNISVFEIKNILKNFSKS